MGIQPTYTSLSILLDILPPEQLDQLARYILEALSQDAWGTVKIEIRNHHLHAISIEKSQLIKKTPE